MCIFLSLTFSDQTSLLYFIWIQSYNSSTTVIHYDFVTLSIPFFSRNALRADTGVSLTFGFWRNFTAVLIYREKIRKIWWDDGAKRTDFYSSNQRNNIILYPFLSQFFIFLHSSVIKLYRKTISFQYSSKISPKSHIIWTLHNKPQTPSWHSFSYPVLDF